MFLMILEEVEITILTACWLMSITQAAFLLKLLIFYLKRYDLRDIENFLISEEPFHTISHFKRAVIRKNLKSCRRMFFTYRMFCFITCLGYAICPYIDKGHLLVLPGYIPWDIIKYNFVTNMLQAFTISSSAYINSSLDTLAVALFTVGIVHLENLNEHLRTMEYTRPEDEVEKEFKKMIVHHQNIILIDTLSIEFAMLTSYFMCMMTQVYILTKSGQILTIQSHELVRSVYMGNWYESTPKVRKMISIFLERCKKPIVCTAGNFFTLSLATLITIIKSSYSYYAVLRSIYIKNSGTP
ncbi:odorant receptor 85b-like [Coccinella septempunctata]|uniref:odorant receptor 85b-like n=1 Tax=Coccinella septempunctata TaxID=41139 RepID=UPI001D093076|nr:odorant receptor 85b-like [Coccinella septempunctata]